MSKHLVLSYKPYDFENTQGERVQGIKISYLNCKPSVRDGEFGFPPLIVNVSNSDLVNSIKEVPAIYDMDFEQVTGKNNKPELVLVSMEHVAPADFSLFY